jgi:AcrR family transcriptional regulator
MADVKSLRKPAGGRPRLLTRDRVIDAAVKLGLENFTMKRVAAELGVTIATLYQYVADRDELLRLAVTQMVAALPFPPDTGQHWSVFLRDFAQVLQEVLAADPNILLRFMHDDFGLEAEAQFAQNFLEVMTGRGFSTEEAVDILQRVATAACGGAVVACRDQVRAARTGTLEQAVQTALTHFPPEQQPQLRQVAAYFGAPRDRLALSLVEPLIEQIARRRGESLPEGR